MFLMATTAVYGGLQLDQLEDFSLEDGNTLRDQATNVSNNQEALTILLQTFSVTK